MSTALAIPTERFIPVAPVAKSFPGFEHQRAIRTPNERLGVSRDVIVKKGLKAFAPWVGETIYCENTIDRISKAASTTTLAVRDDTKAIRRPAQIWQITAQGIWVRWLVPTNDSPDAKIVPIHSSIAYGSLETITWIDWFMEEWRFWEIRSGRQRHR